MSRFKSPAYPMALLLFAVAACHSPSKDVPGDPSDHQAWHEVKAGETIYFVGTEPFWGGTVGPHGMVYQTPENAKGEKVGVSRFAGRGGVSFSGELAGGAFTMVVTPGSCSDGMSDARYPFAVLLRIGGATRQGCGWTERRPRTSANDHG